MLGAAAARLERQVAACSSRRSNSRRGSSSASAGALSTAAVHYQNWVQGYGLVLQLSAAVAAGVCEAAVALQIQAAGALWGELETAVKRLHGMVPCATTQGIARNRLCLSVCVYYTCAHAPARAACPAAVSMPAVQPGLRPRLWCTSWVARLWVPRRSCRTGSSSRGWRHAACW